MARAAEECGFDSIWVGDHMLYRGDDRPERGPWDAWTLLAALAASTGRVRLVSCAPSAGDRAQLLKRFALAPICPKRRSAVAARTSIFTIRRGGARCQAASPTCLTIWADQYPWIAPASTSPMSRPQRIHLLRPISPTRESRVRSSILWSRQPRIASWSGTWPTLSRRVDTVRS